MRRRLGDYFCRRGDVRLAVLFGSAATGLDRPDSDVDVGVLTAPTAATGFDSPVFQAVADLAQALGRKVDVVDLSRADPVFAFSVAQDGQLLYESTPGDWVDWRAAAILRYCDTEWLRRIDRQARLARLEEAP